ncbi:cobalt transport protein [Methanothermus fervidus DSM 2088]|uniref:Cobalt transport protein CbiN n=1 Tax=Methanothermus fervidus (strain ATCC 43054 / DSM 2088 / JCM 10308 / V24 S) TaxID=523846 RepID=E3GVY3_METFV|nr:energy-coupling factor ABC transporter substrate-binding protein [Methanothermus fervidus]ADP77748.1 cobalt transport protein [Methanothermus fervidus DSM 2088]
MDRITIVSLILVAVICAIPLIMYAGKGEEQGYFKGSDDVGTEAIESTGYKPWLQPIWQPPSGEIESLLFAVQAGIGAFIIGYVFGRYMKSKSSKT